MALVAAERLIRNCSFVAPFPLRVGGPSPRVGGPSPKQGDQRPLGSLTGEDVRGGRDPVYIHTVSSMSIAAAPYTNQDSARKRKGLFLHLNWVEAGCSQL